MRKIVTEEEKRMWAERYTKGETARSIAKDYPQYNENTISRHIRKMGLSRGKGVSFEYENLKPIIIQEYQNDKKATLISLSRKYNICDRTISEWLKAAGIEIKQKQGFLTNCDTSYFKEINTPHKAYLLGFITADGSIIGAKEYEPNCCALEVEDKDKEVLEFAKSQINPDAALTPCYYNSKHNFKVSFNSKELCSDLSKYGIIRNKSKIIKEVPINLIPKNLLPFYFRGLIDGDGCVHKRGAISIYSGSEEFIKSVQDILVTEIGVKKLGIYKGTTYFISWAAREDREKLYHYLYDDLNATYYYKRKFNRLYNSLYDNTEVIN